MPQMLTVLKMDYKLVLMFIALIIDSAIGTAEVMSHVTAHFGQALEECRQEVSLYFRNDLFRN